jgi:tripartite-type tricarboxylate transporter receptor subunit TctC
MGLSTVPWLYKKVAFDPLASFEFIGLFAEAPMMIMTRQEFEPRTFAELVAWARARKDKFTMAAAGMGSATHLCAILFQEQLGVPITIVQYKGAGPAVIDVRSGQVDAICDLPTTTSGQVRAGELRAYLLTAPQRLATLPDVPTAGELGMPSLDIGVWFGLYAPLGTPRPIVMTLNRALREIVQDKAVAEKLAGIETLLLPLEQATPEGHRARLAAQIAKWGPIIAKAGIQAE